MHITPALCCNGNVPDLKTLAKMSVASVQENPRSHDFGYPVTRLNDQLKKLSCSTQYLQNEIDAPTENVRRECPRPLFTHMKYEAARLKSFQNKWPLTFIKPSDLAAIGLFYLGVGDRVQCAFCRGIISDWDEHDVPLQEHVRHFPTCPFLLSADVGNVPLSGSNGSQPWQICNAVPECSSSSIAIKGNRMSQNGRIKYPTMSSINKRIETYSSWPKMNIISPSQLADSGFFFSGVADVATCYACGGTLGNWEEGDNAWTEHAKHFPQCSYVRCIKGSDFIETTRQNSVFVSEDVTGCYSNQNEMTPEMDVEIQSATAAFDEPTPTGSESIISTEHGATTSTTKYTCKICMDEGGRVAFLPCGHSLACPTCASKLSDCPMCRQKINSVIRIYFD